MGVSVFFKNKCPLDITCFVASSKLISMEHIYGADNTFSFLKEKKKISSDI